MAVITNDAWWDDTPGHRQHFLYAKLRAVETRRTILRSANTGFSGIINERGDVLQKTAYNERTAIHALVYPNDKLTFYTLNGDYIARIALFTLPLLLLFSIFVKIKTKIKRVKK
jgi:apolipoprotein N-acyltransferase